MFSKAKIKRFNEEAGCGPPPTKYDPKFMEKPTAHYFEKSNRWMDPKEATPGPYSYCGPILPNFTPKKTNRSVGLNSSTCSSGSTSSHGGFATPAQPFVRSKSCRSSKTKFLEENNLKDKVKVLMEEKSTLKQSVEQLEKELAKLKCIQDNTLAEPATSKVVCHSGIQVDLFSEDSKVDAPEPTVTKEVTTIKKEELQILREQIDHLIILRDNLESSIAVKDEAIADLQMQIDLVVAEAEESHEEMEIYKSEVKQIKDELERTFAEKDVAESRVQNLITKYEALMTQQRSEMRMAKDSIAEKDIEIELLNDSIATLNTQISEFEKTINRIQSDVSLKKSQISSLEVMVGDLSMATKEKEVMEAMLEDEIKEKNYEVNEMEDSLKHMEERLTIVTEERDDLLSMQEIEKERLESLESQLKEFEMNLKEKEVLQQFLEKEMASREAEVAEANKKVSVLEDELNTARRIALDLQQEAEAQLNEMIGLKASLTVKNFDIETKDDLISSLKDEVNTTCTDLKEKIKNSDEMSKQLKMEFEDKCKVLSEMEEKMFSLKASLKKEEENTAQLQKKIVELMTEISDREAAHKQRLIDKESEIEELSVKYSDALLDQEATRRLLGVTAEKLEKEALLLQATERELENHRLELVEKIEENSSLESSFKELTHKLVHIEDALACEEAAANEAQEKLKSHIETSQKVIDKMSQEQDALRSSNNGFIAQITQLKIDMTKKSVAVEDMQVRIENLREEKNSILGNCAKVESKLAEKESMLSDLQNEFEGRLKMISDLNLQLSEKQNDFTQMKNEFEAEISDQNTKISQLEEEKSNYSHQVSHLENHLKEEREERAKYKTKVLELEEKLSSLEEEKGKIIQRMTNQIENEKQKANELDAKLNSLQQMYEGYEDQLNNMQTSLTNKTCEVEKFEQSYLESSVQACAYKEKVDDLQSNINRLVQESEQLSSSLSSKDKLLTSLNESVSVKSDEIHHLQKNLEEKQMQFMMMEKRLHDMETSIEILRGEKEEATSRISYLQEYLDQTKEASRLNESQGKELEARISNLLAEHEKELFELKKSNATLKEESHTWKTKFEYLENMVEPFREQLDSYKIEKAALLSKCESDHEEVNKLSSEYAKLLGHNNHKQKIHHVIKLKTENNELREKVHKLQLEVEKQKKAVQRLEDRYHSGILTKGKKAFSKSKIDPENKENSSLLASGTSSDFPQVTSTPLRSSNRYYRL